jgi:hypothetical protein
LILRRSYICTATVIVHLIPTFTMQEHNVELVSTLKYPGGQFSEMGDRVIHPGYVLHRIS